MESLLSLHKEPTVAFVTYGLSTIKSEFTIRYSANLNNSDERDPSIIALADDGFALAYEWRSMPAPTNTTILLERYTSDGVLRPSSDFLGVSFVNTFVAGEENADPAITQLTALQFHRRHG